MRRGRGNMYHIVMPAHRAHDVRHQWHPQVLCSLEGLIPYTSTALQRNRARRLSVKVATDRIGRRTGHHRSDMSFEARSASQ